MNMTTSISRISTVRARGTRRGFTLIEILVVMAIIGLLATIVLGSLSIARKKSRDARRVADLTQLHNALELYVNENKVSPATLATIAPQYIAAIPDEPSGVGFSYGYVQVPGTTGSYALGAVMEGTGQVPPLTNDYDGARAITINGVATDCDPAVSGSGANEKVYCVFSP